MKLECGGGASTGGSNCSRPPRFATWCSCEVNESGGTLACALFFFCDEHLREDLERDPGDEVLELEERGGELVLRPKLSTQPEENGARA